MASEEDGASGRVEGDFVSGARGKVASPRATRQMYGEISDGWARGDKRLAVESHGSFSAMVLGQNRRPPSSLIRTCSSDVDGYGVRSFVLFRRRRCYVRITLTVCDPAMASRRRRHNLGPPNRKDVCSCQRESSDVVPATPEPLSAEVCLRCPDRNGGHALHRSFDSYGPPEGRESRLAAAVRRESPMSSI